MLVKVGSLVDITTGNFTLSEQVSELCQIILLLFDSAFGTLKSTIVKAALAEELGQLTFFNLFWALLQLISFVHLFFS